MSLKDKLYIGGKWVDSSSGQWLDVVDPATEQVFHRVPAGNKNDIDLAVKSARAAFELQTGPSAWSTIPGKERAKYIRKIAELLEQRSQELAKIETRDSGKPFREAVGDLEDVVSTFRLYADLAEKLDQRQNSPVAINPPELAAKYSTIIRYEPVGVVAAIVPWNYPLLMTTWKVAPALAAGCTIILKPSEYTPCTALELAAICDAANLPPGVLNVVTGDGPGAGEPLSAHPGIDKVAFTGSVPTGRRVVTTAAQHNCFHVSLELGGKSAFIVFDDSNVEEAVEWAMFGCFYTNGQVCSATSRLLLQSGIKDKVLKRLKEETEKIFVGDPFTEKDPSLGPLVSGPQYKRVLSYLEKGKQEGATVLTGGGRASGHEKGYFVAPTVFVDVKEGMTIWKEEIFGPVLSVMEFQTEEEAIQKANNTEYGLGAAVMSKDKDRCDRVARRLRAGIVWVNCSQPTLVQCPWGGFGASGSGHRELGEWGLENYLEVKQITKYTSSQAWGWYIKKPSL